MIMMLVTDRQEWGTCSKELGVGHHGVWNAFGMHLECTERESWCKVNDVYKIHT